MKKAMMIIIITSVAALAIGIATARPSQPRGQARAINPPGTPAGLPFSNGILVGDTLYVAGMQGTNASGKLEPGIEAQTRAALEAIRRVVQGAGMTMGDVVAVNVYITDLGEFSKMNAVYKTFFPNPKPTRTTVQAAGLAHGARIEISAIAVKHR